MARAHWDYPGESLGRPYRMVLRKIKGSGTPITDCLPVADLIKIIGVLFPSCDRPRTSIT